jgi:UDP-glucose 6-dehydrogenase
VAEAAKVIENAQRDINIAFVNDLAMLFNCMKISTSDVLAAAGIKWNFLPFSSRPGRRSLHPRITGAGRCAPRVPDAAAENRREAGDL